MFKKCTIMMVSCLTMYDIQACLKVAIPVNNICAENSLLFIALDGDGVEQIAGCVSLAVGKIQYAHHEIRCDQKDLPVIIDNQSVVIVDVEQEQTQTLKGHEETFMYLYFEVDPNLHIVRALVIKNNLLENNPYDVVEFSLKNEEEDEDDDDFFDTNHDDLVDLNLQNIKMPTSQSLSSYDKLILFLVFSSERAKQTYQQFKTWLRSYHGQ